MQRVFALRHRSEREHSPKPRLAESATCCCSIVRWHFDHAHILSQLHLHAAAVTDNESMLDADTVGSVLCCNLLQLNIFPARTALLDLLWPHQAVSRLHENLATLTLVFSALLLAIFVPGLTSLFAVLGSSTGLILAYILPAAFFLELMPRTEKNQWMRKAAWLLVGGSSLMMLLTLSRSVRFLLQPQAKQ
jgi:hypothetical protein